MLWKALPNAFGLTSLNLRGNPLGDHGVSVIASCLDKCRALQELNIACSDVRVEGCKALGKALPKNSSLLTLNISGNTIHWEGWAALLTGLRQNGRITSLLFHNTDPTENMRRSINDALVQNRVERTVAMWGYKPRHHEKRGSGWFRDSSGPSSPL